MAILKQSTTYTRMFLLVQSSDHVTGLTGATATVNLSKAGGTFGAAGGTITEVANGFYKIVLTTTDTNTLGDLAFHITATSADPTDFVDQVTANILGDTLPANVTQISGSAVSTTIAQLGVNAVNLGGTAQTGRDIGASVLLSNGTGTGQVSLSAGKVTVGTNSDKTGYSLTQSFPTNFSTLGISATGHISNVDTLTTYTGNTPQTGDAYARLGAPAGASVSADIAAVNTKTTNLPSSPAATGDAMALTTSERASVADAMLDRDMSTGTDSGSSTVRTVRQALRFLRNKWVVSGTTLTVYKEDDATSSWTSTVSSSATADPIVGSDPA